MVEAFEAEWQVVSRKKGGKTRQKEEQATADSPSVSQPRKQQLAPGSPSSMSCRSRTSTKVPTEAPSSFPESPAMDSSWSETSTDVVLTSLDESALTDESCSLQESSSHMSLEIVATSDFCTSTTQASLHETDAFDGEGLAPLDPAVSWGKPQQPRISETLSCAMKRCTEQDESAFPRKNNVQMQKAPSMVAESLVEKITRQAQERRTQRNHRGAQVTHTPKSKQNVTSEKGIRESSALATKHKHDASSSSPTAGRRKDQADIPPLGSAWVHNGRRDETAEWRLVNFQPLWQVTSRGVTSHDVHLPVSVQAIDAGMHLVIQQSFLSLEPICIWDRHRERGRSLGTCLRGKWQ